MPSRTITLTQAPAAAPFTYTVGGTDGLTPESVFVHWDGSLASGDFLPCVSYYDRDGNLLDRAFPTTGPVVAGDSADVSYRPFDRGGGGGGTPASPLLTDDGGIGVATSEITFANRLTWTNLGGGHVRVDADAPTIPTQWVRHAVFTGDFNPVIGISGQQILWDTIPLGYYTPEAAWASLPPGGSNGAGITSAGDYLIVANVVCDAVLNQNTIIWGLALNGFTPAGQPGLSVPASFIEGVPGLNWYPYASLIVLARLPVAPGAIELILSVNATGAPLTQTVVSPGAHLTVVKLSP